MTTFPCDDMARDGWHIVADGAGLTLTRRLPARFDVAATADFPHLSRLRLAHQVRQDLWRALCRVRGFAPVVRVARVEDGLCVTAGGALASGGPRKLIEARIAALLADPSHRARWAAHARTKDPAP